RDRQVLLRAKEYALLEYLARHSGEVVSRGDIAEHVWDEHYDPMSNVVDVYFPRVPRKRGRPAPRSRPRVLRRRHPDRSAAHRAPADRSRARRDTRPADEHAARGAAGA